MSKTKELKKPVNLTLTPRVIWLMEEVMALRGHNSMSGFIEELIRDEYELRFGPIEAKGPASSAQVQSIADAIEAEAISKIVRGRVRKKRGVPVRKPAPIAVKPTKLNEPVESG